MDIDLNNHELAFATEINGEEYTIAVDKVGGGTIGSRYECEDWSWTAYDSEGENVKEGRFHICSAANHFGAAKHIFELIEEGSVKLSDVTERVDRGVHALDSTVPNWRRLVDTDRLDIDSAQQCVLAQVFYSYNVGLTLMLEMDRNFDATEFGFDSKGNEGGELTSEWISRILNNG